METQIGILAELMEDFHENQCETNGKGYSGHKTIENVVEFLIELAPFEEKINLLLKMQDASDKLQEYLHKFMTPIPYTGK